MIFVVFLEGWRCFINDEIWRCFVNCKILYILLMFVCVRVGNDKVLVLDVVIFYFYFIREDLLIGGFAF